MNTVSEQIPLYGPVIADVDTSQPAASAVAWGAILAGAAAAAVLSLILLILGTGLGLSSISPWANNGVSTSTFGIGTILWLTFIQLVAAGMGGYLAGRLRTKWLDVHRDEVFFRDSAHGFLAWAIASLATATLLTSVLGAIVNGGVQAGASVAGGAALVATAGGAAAGSQMLASETDNYFLDSLFRRDVSPAAIPLFGEQSGAPSSPAAAPSMVEVARIFMNSLRAGAMPADDMSYVGQLVAQRTGLAQADAEQRVGETFARLQAALDETQVAAREAADSARKASAYTAIWLFVALLIGAFVASLAATYGGRQRDA